MSPILLLHLQKEELYGEEKNASMCQTMEMVVQKLKNKSLIVLPPFPLRWLSHPPLSVRSHD